MRNKAESYDYYTDPESGKLFGIDTTTGEQFGASHIIVPDGSWVITPKEQEEYKQRKNSERAHSLRRSVSKSMGGFLFIPNSEHFTDISAATIARLVYLSTFSDYSGNLTYSQRRRIYTEDLERVLKLSPSQTRRFLKSVSPKYISISEDRTICLNRNIFVRGSVKNDIKHKSYSKVFFDGVRKLYNSTPTNNHKQLGYVFQMIPYINLEYNLVCFNPNETDLDSIELISIKGFCELIGYDVKHWSTLLTIFNNITFDVNGKQEKLCTFVYDGVHNPNAKICINPHIIYSGTDYQKVEVLGAFFA